jgi:hypothetical protein
VATASSNTETQSAGCLITDNNDLKKVASSRQIEEQPVLASPMGRCGKIPCSLHLNYRTRTNSTAPNNIATAA